MKKIISFSLLCVCVLLLAGCAKETPGAAAKRQVENLLKGNTDQYIKDLYYGDQKPAESDITMLRGLFEASVQKMKEEKGGVPTIKVISEKISDDGKRADVTLLYSYKNGDESEEDVEMVNDNGKWKMELSK